MSSLIGRADQPTRPTDGYGPIFEVASDAIFVHDGKTGAILDVNPRAVEMYGYSREEMRRIDIAMISADEPPHTQSDALRWLDRARLAPQVFEWRARARNGHLFWVEVSIRRVEIAGEDRLLAIARDVTERKRAEAERERLIEEAHLARRRIEELAAEAERHAAELRSVLDNMVDAVFVCSPDGQLTLTNAAAARLFGVPHLAEVRNVPREFPKLLGLRYPNGRPIRPEETATARALAGETVTLMDQVFFNPQLGQDRYIRVSAAPFRSAEGDIDGAVVVARDVTELMELDRLKDEFVLVAAHELKTPVAIMKGYAEVLARSPDGCSSKQRRMLEAIDRGADRIDDVVTNLLDISQLHLGRLTLRHERVGLAELVGRAIDRKALGQKKHRIRLISAEPANVEGDPERLEEVILTLLDNAIRYSPKGGEINVALSVQARGEGHEVGGREATVSVRDWGVGIPKTKQRRVFERFYRAHTGSPHDYGGMGVGLYIANEIVGRHDGRMWFESEEGRGSTFSFSLPVAEPDAADEH